MGTARSFDGANTRVVATVIAIGAADWTVAVWVNPSGPGEGNAGQILNAFDGSVADQLLRFAGVTQTVECRQNASVQNASAQTVATLTNGVWRCIVGTFRTSDGKCRVYLGTEQTPMTEGSYGAQTTLSGTKLSTAATAYIGNNQVQTATWNGSIASLILDAREWSLAEMEYYRQTSRPPSFGSTLRGWWPLDGTRSDEPDKSGLTAAATVTSPTSPSFTTGPTLWLPRKVRPRSLVAR